MKALFKELARRRASRLLRRRLAESDLSEALAPVQRALERVVETTSGSVEAALGGRIERIEAIRERYRGDDRQLEIVDYGAGPPDAGRSWDDMAAGTASTITLDQACRASKPFFWSLFLYELVRELAPSVVVELGTCLGLSAAYQASAGAGRVVTLEGATPLASLAREHLEELGLDTVEVVEGPFQETFAAVLESNAPIDLLFVDGHHDEEATVRYFNRARPWLSEGATIVFDDIEWSQGMRLAWASVCRQATGAAALSLGDLGVLVLGPERAASEAARPFRLEVPSQLVRFTRP